MYLSDCLPCRVYSFSFIRGKWHLQSSVEKDYSSRACIPSLTGKVHKIIINTVLLVFIVHSQTLLLISFSLTFHHPFLWDLYKPLSLAREEIWCIKWKTILEGPHSSKFSHLRRLERVFCCCSVCEKMEDYKERYLMVWTNYMCPCSSIVGLYFKGTCDGISVTMATHKVHKSVL